MNLDGNVTGGSAADNTLANCSVGGAGITLPSQFSSKYTFSQPLLGTNGTCGRNIARQPGLENLNAALTKNILLAEKGWWNSGPWNLQLRWEVYNVLNNPSFYVASVNNLYVSNPTTFGALTPLSQRRMEMAVRILW